MTKEPKLARARQIPEWEEYDGEIAMFTKKLADEGKIRKGAAVVDINVLAGEPVAAEPVVEHTEDLSVEKDESPVVEEQGDDRIKDEL